MCKQNTKSLNFYFILQIEGSFKANKQKDKKM